MAGVSLPNDLPPGYMAAYGGKQLRDPPDAAQSADTPPAVREFAEASVRTIQRLVFPIHGLRSSLRAGPFPHTLPRRSRGTTGGKEEGSQ